MHNIAHSVIRFFVRHILKFVIAVVVLVAGGWGLAQVREYQAARAGLEIMEGGATALDAYRAGLARDVAARAAAFRSQSASALRVRIAALEREIRAKSDAQDAPYLAFPLPDSRVLAQRLVTHSRRALEIEVLVQERDYLAQLLAAGAGLQERAAQLQAAHAAASARLGENLRAQAQLKQQSPFLVWIPGTREQRRMAQLGAAASALQAQSRQAYDALLAQKKIGELPRRLARFTLDEERVTQALEPLRDGIAGGRAAQAQNWVARAAGPVMDVVPAAAMLVLGALLVPLAMKCLFYFGLAPLAGRLRVAPLERGAGAGVQAGASAVSQAVVLGADDEMLIHSEYIQSSSVSGNKDTKWLLDWSCPFTSIAAGLVALTRIRAGQAGTVVVSASDDPLAEVALLRLPPGAAMVFQPRGLVGVVHPKNQPLAMTRHWRLGSLHAWLTLQLRYIVLRGPVTLIVKGARGVRVEAAGDGRSISQAATLGFSANLAYSTVRSETFFPYLAGKQALLNDRFHGQPGVYVYEETPRAGKRPGLVGKGFGGITDALLKVFGI